MLRRCLSLHLIKFDIYVRSGKKALEYMKNYINVAKKVKKLIHTYWPKAKIYVFGSVINGRYTAASDIDILVVLDKKPNPKEEVEVKASIYMRLDAPIQLHIVSRRELEFWYKRFIDRIIEIP